MTILFVVIFGLIIGSFLNVCIYRVPRKLSVVSPRRSFCPECKHQLNWWENIPVFSWLFLRAKCHHCSTPISGQYPLVELLSAIAAAATFLKFQLTPTGLVIFLLVETLLVITFIDFEFKIIPDRISFPGMTFGLCLGIISQYTPWFTSPITESAFDSLLGFIAGGGFFYAIGIVYYMISKRVGLGGGDIKLMAVTGSILGVDSIIPTIFAGSISGSVVGILVMLLKRGGRHTEIPFGPWLSLGAIVYIFFDLPYFRVY